MHAATTRKSHTPNEQYIFALPSLPVKLTFVLFFVYFFFRYDKDPWEHVAFGVVGGTVGYQFSKYNDRNRQDLLQLMGSMDKFGTAETSHDEE